jgi:ATP adenylyltransferase
MKHLWSPWRMEYFEKRDAHDGCIFCEAQSQVDSAENLIVHRWSRAYVILNRYPYTSGHLMVAPFAHVATLEGLDAATRGEMMELASRAIAALRVSYAPQAFNLGANIGEAAGAGVKEHVHLHVVPRWSGDTNFMSTLAQTRVLPETLTDTYARLRAAFQGYG